MAPLVHVNILLVVAEALRMRDGSSFAPPASEGRPSDEDYTFDMFMQDFGRTYKTGGEEYAQRSAFFQSSLTEIHAKNSRADRSWTAGVHPFMDWTGAERAAHLHGYVFTGMRRTQLAEVQTQTGASEKLYGGDGDNYEALAGPARNQGLCGSCWAMTSVEAVEAQLLRSNSSLSFQDGKGRVSPQALLDCVENPQHCGGKGGCTGATPQLAFAFVRDHGLPLEADVPYKMADTYDCPMQKAWPSSRPRVTVDGWEELPTNQAQPLMRAIVELGPVAVSVAAQKWYPYRLGIYDECTKDCVPNHSVLAKGYGSEDGLGKYWLLQNSWGSQWGEQGSIRIRRHDDEDQWCGEDNSPQEGAACDGGPDRVTVCGSCGILYDSIVPRGARLQFPAGPGGGNYHDDVSESSADLMLSSYPAASTASSPSLPAVQEAMPSEAPTAPLVNDVPVESRSYDDIGAAHAANRMLSSYQGGTESASDESPVEVTRDTPAQELPEAHADILRNLAPPESSSVSSRMFALRADTLAPTAQPPSKFQQTVEAMADDDDLHMPGYAPGQAGQSSFVSSFVPMTAADSSFHDAGDVLEAYNSAMGGRR